MTRCIICPVMIKQLQYANHRVGAPIRNPHW
nr:MAG TPA: hypothetical protein [Caudoviricetes sp.]